MDPVFKPKLPSFGNEDGDQVITSNGVVYEYNAEKNEWISRGVIPDPDVVDSEDNGLISPDIYRKLSLIQELIDDGFDFSRFKLDSNAADPYFYYFYSSDDLIRFYPEKIINPKEVKISTIVDGIFENSGQGSNSPVGTTTLNLDRIIGSAEEFVGFQAESRFGVFDIVFNSDFQVIVKGDVRSLKIGDSVKIVKPSKIDHQLRIEVDRSRLYQKLMRNCCVGPKGLQGDIGDQGSSGIAATNEVFQGPTNTMDGSFSWESVVEIPIETPISLRIFRTDNDDSNIIEVQFPLDGTPPIIIVNDDSIDIEVSSVEIGYSTSSKVFSGSIVILSGGDDSSTWRYKARQQGAKGKTGDDGKAFLEVATRILDDPSIRSVEAIISSRKASAADDIIIFRRELFDEIPVSNLSAIEGESIVNLLSERFVAAQVTVREAKDVGFYQFVHSDFVPPDLDIPLWTPTRDCVQARRWSQYRFDWYNRSDPTYIFAITPTPKPPEECCQEDFFFCPNIGDGPCEIIGEPKPPAPFPTPCECDCECPVATELASGMGLVFDPIDMTDPDNVVPIVTPGIALLGEINLNFGSIQSPPDAVVDPDFVLPIEGVDGQDVSCPALEEGSAPEEIIPIIPEDIPIVSTPPPLVPSDPPTAPPDTPDVPIVVASNGVECVIDGTEQMFVQDIVFCGVGEVKIEIAFDDDVCADERSGCAFVESNAVQASYSLEDRNNVSSIGNGGFSESQVIPSTVVFSVSTLESDVASSLDEQEESVSPGNTLCPEGITPTKAELANLKLTILFNTTKVNYCRGYRLVITSTSDRIECEVGDTVIEVNVIDKPRIPLDDGGVVIDEDTGLVVDDERVDYPPPTCDLLGSATTVGTPVGIVLFGGDPAGGTLSFSAGPLPGPDFPLAGPLNGVVTGVAPNLIYTPNGSFVGTDSFEYLVRSSVSCKTSICAVIVNVSNEEDEGETALPPPACNDQEVATLEDIPVGINLGSNCPKEEE